ncbi:LysR family transcriptional regulator [Streptomyces sp. NPDC001123]
MDAHIRDLRYFVAIAEELNFTRAAERLLVSQPALSKQIRHLEERMRVRLFDRSRQAVSLTPAGQALLPGAREIIQQWEEAQRAVSDAAAAAAAVLTIGVSTSIGRGLLQRARAHFAQRRPDWRVQVRQINWEDATAGLAGGAVDVALVWLPVPNQDTFNIQVLVREPRWVAVRKDHRLADSREVAFAELVHEPFLALPESAGPLRDYWLALAARDGRPARIGAVVSNADETFAAIEEGSGIVLLAAGNARIYQRPDIVTVPVRGLSAAELALAWRPDDHRGAIRDFIDALTPA